MKKIFLLVALFPCIVMADPQVLIVNHFDELSKSTSVTMQEFSSALTCNAAIAKNKENLKEFYKVAFGTFADNQIDTYFRFSCVKK